MSRKAIYIVLVERTNDDIKNVVFDVDVYRVTTDFDCLYESVMSAVNVNNRNRVYTYEFSTDAQLHCIGCVSNDMCIHTHLNYGRSPHGAHYAALLKGLAMAYSLGVRAPELLGDNLPGDVAVHTVCLDDEEMFLGPVGSIAPNPPDDGPCPAA